MLGGMARLFREPAGFKRAYELESQPSVGLNLCLGCCSEMPGGKANVREMIEFFGPKGKIFYVHFRDVQGIVPHFIECFIGDGNYDPAEIMRLLRDSGSPASCSTTTSRTWTATPMEPSRPRPRHRLHAGPDGRHATIRWHNELRDGERSICEVRAMIDTSHLHIRVYEWLKDRILHHVFLPGDKLDIQQLADDLGVSRTPVKEAINRLTLEGLVTLRNRRGTYVASLTEEIVRELIETRMMIECWAVEHLSPAAMANVRPHVAEMLDRIERSLLVTKASLFDGAESYALDREWHALIVRLTGNGTMLDFHQGVSARLQVGSLYFLTDEECSSGRG